MVYKHFPNPLYTVAELYFFPWKLVSDEEESGGGESDVWTEYGEEVTIQIILKPEAFWLWQELKVSQSRNLFPFGEKLSDHQADFNLMDNTLQGESLSLPEPTWKGGISMMDDHTNGHNTLGWVTDFLSLVENRGTIIDITKQCLLSLLTRPFEVVVLMSNYISWT